jgi:hypothetical protein
MPKHLIRSISSAQSAVNEGLLSVREAARFLGISPGTLRNTDVPFVAIRRRRLYRPQDLRRWVEQHLSRSLNMGES